MIDLGTGNNNKINWAMEDKQEMIDIIETVYRGARKGRGLVVSPKDYSTKYRYWCFFGLPLFIILCPLKFISVYVCTYMYIKREKFYNFEHNLNYLKDLYSVWEAEDSKPGIVLTAVILLDSWILGFSF